MTLKDLLKKKNLIREESKLSGDHAIITPEVILMRSDTHTQEIISAPTYPGDESSLARKSQDRPRTPTSPKWPFRFRSLSSTSNGSKDSKAGVGERPGNERRLSQLLHIRLSSHSSRHSSVYVPDDLPQIEDGVNASEDQEAQWEERATLLAKENLNLWHDIVTEDVSPPMGSDQIAPLNKRASAGLISNAQGDVNSTTKTSIGHGLILV